MQTGLCLGNKRLYNIPRGFWVRTQPLQSRRPWRGCSLPCHPWQGIAGRCRGYLRDSNSLHNAPSAYLALWPAAVLAAGVFVDGGDGML